MVYYVRGEIKLKCNTSNTWCELELIVSSGTSDSVEVKLPETENLSINHKSGNFLGDWTFRSQLTKIHLCFLVYAIILTKLLSLVLYHFLVIKLQKIKITVCPGLLGQSNSPLSTPSSYSHPSHFQQCHNFGDERHILHSS